MRICLISEGSYPYVTGGVSSWISQLMQSMPEHEFVIVAINPDSIRKGQYKYELPANLIHLQEIFLDEIQRSQGKWNRHIPLNKTEVAILKDVFLNRPVDWINLFKAFSKPEFRKLNGSDIMMSQMFYDLVRAVYKEKYDQESFTEVYWTLRSMYGLFFFFAVYQVSRS